MRICMFTNTYIPHVGGVARSVISFSEDLKNMGHQILVIAPEFAEMDISEENSEETLRVPAIQNFNGSDFSVRIPIPFLIDNKLDLLGPGDLAPQALRGRYMGLIGMSFSSALAIGGPLGGMVLARLGSTCL